MLETTEIIKAIKENNANDLALKVKNSKTGEILGVKYNYVADEILFIFASKTGTGTCNNYLRQLEGESQDDCWIDYALTNLNQLLDSDEDLTEDDLDEEELYKAKYDVVTNLLTRVYVGNLNECPIKCYDETFELVGVEVTNEAVLLVY